MTKATEIELTYAGITYWVIFVDGKAVEIKNYHPMFGKRTYWSTNVAPSVRVLSVIDAAEAILNKGIDKGFRFIYQGLSGTVRGDLVKWQGLTGKLADMRHSGLIHAIELARDDPNNKITVGN